MMSQRNVSYVRVIDGRTETMIEIEPHVAINEKAALALGLVNQQTVSAPAPAASRREAVQRRRFADDQPPDAA
jgi:hypothetical protein